MKELAVFLVGFLATAYAAGDFIVLNHPQSAGFKGHEAIKESLLPEVYSALLGYSTQRDSNWGGLYLKDPFNLCTGIVTLVVDGISDIGLVKGHSFALHTDVDESEIYEETVRRIEQHHPEEKGVYRIDLSKGIEGVGKIDAFKAIKSVTPEKTARNILKLSREEDKNFLEELALLNQISENLDLIPTFEYAPNMVWIKMSSLHAISDFYGENSTEIKEAKTLLNDAIIKLKEKSEKVFEGRALTNIITSDASHTRLMRQANEAGTTKEDEVDHNLAKQYDEEYPVIFNIIFWFAVIMIFTLLAICVFIASMDPGRDSIIYRMTSTRMKKD